MFQCAAPDSNYPVQLFISNPLAIASIEARSAGLRM